MHEARIFLEETIKSVLGGFVRKSRRVRAASGLNGCQQFNRKQSIELQSFSANTAKRISEMASQP